VKLLLLALFFLGCTHSSYHPKSWGIWLQNQNLLRIKNSPQELWVIDSIYEGREISSTQVEILKASKKKIISYLSIGEAEDYRSYFSQMPGDLKGASNPDFPNNFTVNFWDPRWQEIIFTYLDRIQGVHFDGVFLDIIDAFDRFPDRVQKAQEMAQFIERLSLRGKKKNKNFLVVLQNGIHIRRYLKDPMIFLGSIDGVNVESGFFYGKKVKDNTYQANPALLEDIGFYQSHGKFILSLEYLQRDDLVKEYFDLAKTHNLIPLAAEKNLQGSFISPPSP
jgi:cysteinyl-tRNA synthetase, unknown class